MAITSYLNRLIRRAQGDSPAMMPVKPFKPAAVDDFIEEADEEFVALPQRPVAQTDSLSPLVLQNENPPISKGSKHSVATTKPEQILNHIRHFEDRPRQLGSDREQPGSVIEKQDPGSPVRTDLPDQGPIVINEIHRDSARPDSDVRSKVLPDGIRSKRAKAIYNLRSETDIINVVVPDEARSKSHVSDDPVAPPQPAVRIENQPDPAFLSEAPPVLTSSIESSAQPVWPLHPKPQPDPQQKQHLPQDNGATVEIGSVIIETQETPVTPKRPSVPPHGRHRRRPGFIKSEARENQRHQKSVSRLKYGLGAL